MRCRSFVLCPCTGSVPVLLYRQCPCAVSVLVSVLGQATNGPGPMPRYQSWSLNWLPSLRGRQPWPQGESRMSFSHPVVRFWNDSGSFRTAVPRRCALDLCHSLIPIPVPRRRGKKFTTCCALQNLALCKLLCVSMAQGVIFERPAFTSSRAEWQ